MNWALEPLLSKGARCIPVLPSGYIGKCATRVLKRSDGNAGRSLTASKKIQDKGLTHANDSSSIQLYHGNIEIEEANERLLSSNSEISCVCGKVCKVNPGLKSHQRACRTIRGLNQELTNALRSYDDDNEEKVTTDNLEQLNDHVRTKPGIKLPKANSG